MSVAVIQHSAVFERAQIYVKRWSINQTTGGTKLLRAVSSALGQKDKIIVW